MTTTSLEDSTHHQPKADEVAGWHQHGVHTPGQAWAVAGTPHNPSVKIVVRSTIIQPELAQAGQHNCGMATPPLPLPCNRPVATSTSNMQLAQVLEAPQRFEERACAVH
jgi:hypothetical protein